MRKLTSGLLRRWRGDREREARHSILTAIASSKALKLVVMVDPDIDGHDQNRVEWAIAFRSQPARDGIIVSDLPGGTLDPSIDGSLRQTGAGSAMAMDATFPFGADQQKVPDVLPARPAVQLLRSRAMSSLSRRRTLLAGGRGGLQSGLSAFAGRIFRPPVGRRWTQTS